MKLEGCYIKHSNIKPLEKLRNGSLCMVVDLTYHTPYGDMNVSGSGLTEWEGDEGIKDAYKKAMDMATSIFTERYAALKAEAETSDDVKDYTIRTSKILCQALLNDLVEKVLPDQSEKTREAFSRIASEGHQKQLNHLFETLGLEPIYAQSERPLTFGEVSVLTQVLNELNIKEMGIGE